MKNFIKRLIIKKHNHKFKYEYRDKHNKKLQEKDIKCYLEDIYISPH